MSDLTDRIDMEKQPDGQTLILKWDEGWAAGDAPAAVYKTDRPFDEMLDWLKEHDWEIVEWATGARAWKSERRPVRNRGMILKKRRVLENNKRWYQEKGIDLYSIDLAFYL